MLEGCSFRETALFCDFQGIIFLNLSENNLQNTSEQLLLSRVSNIKNTSIEVHCVEVYCCLLKYICKLKSDSQLLKKLGLLALMKAL